MVHILAARGSCQYAAGHGFHSPALVLLWDILLAVFFPYNIICILPCVPPHCVSPFTPQAFFGLNFCSLQPSSGVVICSPSHTTKYSRIVQSCYSSLDHRLTLVFRRVLCSRPFAVCIVNRLHTPIVHTYALVVPLIMSLISTPNQSVDWPFTFSFSVHRKTRA
jgi:hypothetical protein